MNSAASSSAVPPISPTITIAWVAESASNSFNTSMKLVPGNRVAANAYARGLTKSFVSGLLDRFICQSARAGDDTYSTGAGESHLA